MISKQEFVDKFLDKLCHKARPELDKQLPDEAPLSEMIDKTCEILCGLLKN